MPGSHNTKEGGKRPCQVIEATGATYDITELEDMLDLYGQPLLHYAPGKEPKGNKGNGHEEARPVNVELDLAGIQSGADANVEQTRVITSLIGRAVHPDDIARQVLDLTMEAAKRSGLEWDRAAEEHQVTERIKSQYRFFERGYDPAAGIPIWLPMEFHEAWRAAL